MALVIRVINLHDGDVLPHSLALLEGHSSTTASENLRSECEQKSASAAMITVGLKTGGSSIDWPVVNGRFKALVQLARGSNVVQLTCTDHKSEACTLEFHLSYEPPDVGGRSVRLLYVVCANDSGDFQGPIDEPVTVESAARRIVLGARLIQTFTAENMVRTQGLPRRTFRLDGDHVDGGCNDSDPPICQILTLDPSITVDRARAMSERDLWRLVRDTLASSIDSNDESDVDLSSRLKYVAFLSFTRYNYAHGVEHQPLAAIAHDEIVQRTKGHAALGGGGLALLGTGCLHTWAQNLSEIVFRFTDETPVDRLRLMDHSGYRGTHWACYAYTLGAMCHELGHTFGLVHTGHTHGIMGRGFGDIHRVFVIASAPDESKDDEAPSDPEMYGLHMQHYLRNGRGVEWGHAYWERLSAAWLSYHKWFNPTSVRDSGQGPKLYNRLEIRARHGLRSVVLLENCDRVISYWGFLRGYGRPTFRLPFDNDIDIDYQCLSVKAMDTFGNILDTSATL